MDERLENLLSVRLAKDNVRTMTDKEAAAPDKKISVLQEKIIKVKHKYEDMLERLNDLMEQCNPEKKEEAVKERLWKAYQHSTKSLDFIRYSFPDSGG